MFNILRSGFVIALLAGVSWGQGQPSPAPAPAPPGQPTNPGQPVPPQTPPTQPGKGTDKKRTKGKGTNPDSKKTTSDSTNK
jgi:hypothetical protein